MPRKKTPKIYPILIPHLGGVTAASIPLMASNLYTRKTVDGVTTAYTRRGTQGRKPSGLGKPTLYRLFADDEEILRLLEIKLGDYYNKNEIVRDAVHKAVESIYTELVKQ